MLEDNATEQKHKARFQLKQFPRAWYLVILGIPGTDDDASILRSVMVVKVVLVAF